MTDENGKLEEIEVEEVQEEKISKKGNKKEYCRLYY